MKIRNKIMIISAGLLLWSKSILSVSALQDLSDNPQNSQEEEISEFGSIIRQIPIEASKDGTLVDENHQTLKKVVFDMLENQLQFNQNSFILPVESGYEISAGTWHYGASLYYGYHLGIDFAMPVSTDVTAVSDGIVVASSNSCPTDGYLGSSCGNPGTEGGGNQVYLLTKVNDLCYIIKYLHLKKDSPVPVGAVVKQGDKIGEIGSSGNSSGPHVHVEVFRIEENNFREFLNHWDGDLSFSLGFGKMGYENRCTVKSEAPCREKPESVFDLE